MKRKIIIISTILIIFFVESIGNEKFLYNSYDLYDELDLYKNVEILNIYKIHIGKYWIIDVKIDEDRYAKVITYDTIMENNCDSILENKILPNLYLYKFNFFANNNPYDPISKSFNPYRLYYNKIDSIRKDITGLEIRGHDILHIIRGVNYILDNSKPDVYNDKFLKYYFISPNLFGLKYCDNIEPNINGDTTTFFKMKQGVF